MKDSEIQVEIEALYAERAQAPDLETWDHSRLRALQTELAGRVARRFRDTHLMPPETGPDLLDQIDEILRSTEMAKPNGQS